MSVADTRYKGLDRRGADDDEIRPGNMKATAVESVFRCDIKGVPRMGVTYGFLEHPSKRYAIQRPPGSSGEAERELVPVR